MAARSLGAGMTRADHVVALGGGVVGDLAGFCAATYQRGVPVVQVPTTLVAQVDSAYGGKTGVDLPAGQELRRRLPPAGRRARRPGRRSRRCRAAELAAGWVEVLKTALIAGGRAVGAGRRRRARSTSAMILDCARTKLAVVAADERDGGRRQVLNLGHTVGHAIETATGYARYRHGEAVGLGLLAALRLSGQDAAARAGRASCSRAHGLPTRLDGRRPRTRCSRRSRATRSALGDERAVRARATRPARCATAARSRATRRVRAAVAELCAMSAGRATASR